jgi:hypothetical protein
MNVSKARADRYELAYRADYGFEAVMVRYRRMLLLERLQLHRPRAVVEIGCGAELLYGAWRDQAGPVDRWIIIEPASGFAAGARGSGLPNLQVVEDFCENAVEAVRGLLPSPPDFIVCSCLLHEVPSARALLESVRALMGEATVLHVNVPNANSMHRRVARCMGLIADTKALSDRNIRMGQPRVYDMAALHEEMDGAGMTIVDHGGILIKPFSHKQMEAIDPILGSAVMDGLYRLGQELPELASEIYVEARRAH